MAMNALAASEPREMQPRLQNRADYSPQNSRRRQVHSRPGQGSAGQGIAGQGSAENPQAPEDLTVLSLYDPSDHHPPDFGFSSSQVLLWQIILAKMHGFWRDQHLQVRSRNALFSNTRRSTVLAVTLKLYAL